MNIPGNFHKGKENIPHNIKSKQEFTPKTSVGKTASNRFNMTSTSTESVKKISRKDIQTSHENSPKLESEKMIKNVEKAHTTHPQTKKRTKPNLSELKEVLALRKYFFTTNMPSNPKTITINRKEIERLELEVKELSEKLSEIADEGMDYFEGTRGAGQDYSMAVVYFKSAADQGDSFAQTMLGRCYLEGLGVDPDIDTAVEYFKLAADDGDVHGLDYLGACYYAGVGVDQDFKKAFECFDSAGKKGDPNALFFLGQHYYEGNGVKQDFSKAVEFFRKSTFYEDLLLESADENEMDLESENFGNAETALALAYLTGEGIEQNFNKALEHLTSAAKKGNEVAQQYLDYCFKDGTVVKKTIEEVKKARHEAYPIQNR